MRLEKKTTAILLITIFLISTFAVAMPAIAKKEGTTIQDGVLTYSDGHYLDNEPLQTGFDIFGYNYQGHMFKGSYANSYLGKDGFPPYTGDDESYLAVNPGAASMWYWPYRYAKLAMKWNDAWLSNKDCDGDGILDRAYENGGNYIGSGAWLTNHQSGENEDGTNWNYFVKIVAQNYEGHAEEIEAEEIWGAFMIIQQVSNDPALGEHGLLTLVTPAGLGCYKP